MEVTCPSGLRGELRKLKVKEQGQLLRQVGGGRGADQRSARLNRLMDACWTNTLEKGIYRWEGDRPDWPQLLAGDRLYLLIKIREVTFGSKYEFPVRCQNPPACTAQFRWTVDLTDLPVKSLPEESKKRILEGTAFEAELSDGTVVKYHLPTGKDETGKRDPRLDPVTAAVLNRVDAIGDVTNKKEMITLIEEMDADELDYLLADMEETDCGVDTGFEVQCPYCDALTEVDLPFERTFWMPRTGGRRLRTL